MDGRERRPNILWICTDQQRWDTLGAYGNPWVQTPNLDRLAEGGMVFDRSYCQSPVCTPSRASFLTGRYPRTNRCRQNGQTLPADEVLLTKLLARGRYRAGLAGRLLWNADYMTGLAGKLHLSATHPASHPMGEVRGDDGYEEFHWSHHPIADWPTNEYTWWLREQGLTYHRTPSPLSRYVYAGIDAAHHQTTWCAQKAVQFIRTSAGAPRPWLFSINIFNPHHPFDPPPESMARYADRLDDIPLPRYADGELDAKPAFQRLDHEGAYNTRGLYPWPRMTATDHRAIRAAYWAMVDLIDAQVGRVLRTLEETGQSEHTIVIFMSDHGEMLGDHGMYLKGPYFYEEGVRVPLIVSWPGMIAGGRRSSALVELLDLAPTLLEAAGLEVPAGLQGRSLWPLLRGDVPTDVHREDVYCEYLNAMPWHVDPPAFATMLRTERHKLVRFHNVDEGELYDLERDPGETTNLWSDPECGDLRTDLTERLADRIALTADPLPDREAEY
jgi:arylsulfatase A-like enzyme